MLISGRQAAEMLSEIGLGPEPARRALLAGVAGPAQRSRGALLYDGGAVKRLLVDPVDPGALSVDCWDGMFVGRVGPRRAAPDEFRQWRGADLTAPVAEQRDGVRMYWRIAPLTNFCIARMIERRGFVPFVATVSGFVVVGGDTTGLQIAGDGRGVVMTLTDPTEWFEPLRGGRFVTPAGGPWAWWPARLESLL